MGVLLINRAQIFHKVNIKILSYKICSLKSFSKK